MRADKSLSINIRSLFYLAVLLSFLLLSGCGNDTKDKSRITVSPDQSSGVFALPQGIQATAIDPNNISAALIIDDGTGSPRNEPMVIGNGQAEVTIGNLSPGTYSFTIRFEYTIEGNDSVSLAVAIRENVSIASGTNSDIGFGLNDYSYPDNDSDGVFNIIEIDEGTDPNNSASTPNVECSVTDGVIDCSPINNPPVASLVSISGNAVVGSVLTGSYVYSDTEDDQEGITTFRWLRDGVPISGATSMEYTLVDIDSGSSLNFEVTPVALTGTLVGNPVTSGSVVINNSAPAAIDVSITDNNGGSAVVGDVLTGNYTFSDVDSDNEGASTYRWMRDGVAISGATSLVYTVVALDSGSSLVFEVTPVAATGTTNGTASASTGLFIVNSAPAANNVNIVDNNGGDAVVGDSLSGNYTYSDADNDAEAASTYRWLRDGNPISSATEPNYIIVAEDSGAVLSFEVTPVASSGNTSGMAVASLGITIVNSPPTVTDVSISDNTGGDAVAGDLLTGVYTYNDVDGDAEGTSVYRWLRDGNPISGATALTYTVVTADNNTTLTFEVTPAAASGTIPGAAGTATISIVPNSTPPVVNGPALYLDINTNAICDAGDQIIVRFSQNVVVNAASGGDFNLPVTGDSLGSGATVGAGPASNEVTITLGTSPNLKTRQDFSGVTALNSPSGIDVSSAITANAIESSSGVDAQTSTAIDIVAAYLDSGQSLGSGSSQFVALGDVDGDGDLDMVIANYNGQSNRIYKNDGLGVYTDTNQALGANDSRSVALGDLDGDGDLDVAVANHLGQGNRVYVNNGTGIFSDSSQSLGTDNSASIALGDVDGDGDLDMAVGNVNGQANRIYLNDGTGLFTDTNQQLGSNVSLSVTFGDVDGDGDLDLSVANWNQPNRVYTNDGAGIFSDSAQSLGSNYSHSLALGDVDGDGDMDMVVANVTQGNTVYINDGLGNFSDSGQSLGSNSSYFVALGDVDSDGDQDMMVTNYPNEANRIYINDGSGIFTDSGQALGLYNSYAGAIGDVDGDGDLDIAVSNNGQGNRVYLNSLSSTWGSSTFVDSGQALGAYFTTAVATGDLDKDGDLDFVAGNAGVSLDDPSNRVYLNDGSGNVTDDQQLLGSNSTLSIALGDLDNDGDLDMFVGNANAEPNQVYVNDGVGGFTDTNQALGTENTYSVAMGDLDSDGDLDVVAGNNNGEANKVYFNDGSGTFAESTQLLGANSTWAIALGDIDSDGDLDLVAGNNGQADHIYTNDGSGVFSDSGALPGATSTHAVVLGDVDNDGDLDLVVGNSSVANQVLMNDGNGTFTDSSQSLGADTDNTFSIALLDLDGDGDLDVVAGNYSGIENKIYLNNGGGIFNDSGQALGPTDTWPLAFGDMDADGDPDLVIGNYNRQPNQIYLNK